MDSKSNNTALAVVPTVAVPTSATVEPDADSLMTRLGAMTTPELTTYIKDEITLGERVLADEMVAADEHKRLKGQRLQVTYEVLCALRELKSRLKATKGWEKALRDCGIAPSTWRSWDCRELNQLTTGKRTKSRKADKRSYAQVFADLAKSKAAVAASKAVVDAQRDAERGKPDPIIEAEYIDTPVEPPAVALAKKVLQTYHELNPGVQPDAMCWDALKELAESVMGIEPPTTDAETKDAENAAKIQAANNLCPVCSKPYLRVYTHAVSSSPIYVHTESTGKAFSDRGDFCQTGNPDNTCPVCDEPYVRAWWNAKGFNHSYHHNESWVNGEMLTGKICDGPCRRKAKNLPLPGDEPKKAKAKSIAPVTIEAMLEDHYQKLHAT